MKCFTPETPEPTPSPTDVGKLRSTQYPVNHNMRGHNHAQFVTKIQVQEWWVLSYPSELEITDEDEATSTDDVKYLRASRKQTIWQERDYYELQILWHGRN